MKYGRLGYTESTLLFCHYLRNTLKIDTNEFLNYEINFVQWLFNTSGYYDTSTTPDYNYINTDNYKKLMNEFYKTSKECDFTRFLIHDTHLSKYIPDFYKNFNIIEYNIDIAFIEFKNFIKDKRILIINPMAQLMKKQYDSGNLYKINLFPQVKSIECYKNEYTFFNNSVENNCNHLTSFDYIDSIMPKINEVDVDCVIISCGAVSSLIANRLNKDYLIIGSDLLTFFGIKHDRIKDKYSYNQYWVDVPIEFKPKEYKLIENGCYW